MNKVKERMWWLGVYIIFISPISHADEQLLSDWNMYGSNTLRGSLYDAQGPGAVSPYPKEGVMYFDEFNIYLNKRNSSYDNIRGEISGVYNANDDYRSTNFGLVPERLSFVRENGETGTPYRFEAGDHFAYYSYLTLQNSLKGLQIEFQPHTDKEGRRYSFVFTTGANESNWRSLTLQDDYTTGVSWLMEDQRLGSLSANLVHNYRDKSVKAGTLDRKQYVFSLAGGKTFESSEFNTVFEAEAAHFIGDHNGLTGAISGQDKSENGYFIQLSGRSKLSPWDYRLRFDHYGQDFRPRGAVVTADRRSVELHSGWLHQSGIRSRGRIQFFEDGFETANKTTTRTYGANFSGPLLKRFYSDVNGSLDAFIQKRDNETNSIDLWTRNVNLSLSKPLRHGWVGRTSLFFQNVNDESTSNADIYTRQFTLSADHAITIAGFKGLVTPGILLRAIRKSTNFSTDISPTLAISLNRGPHVLRFDYSGEFQGRDIAVSGADIDTHRFNLDYNYTKQQHVFGLEANLFGRDTALVDSTEAYRVTAYWTYNFDRPAVTVARAVSPVGVQKVIPAQAEVSISGLVPGLTEDAVQLALSKEGISGGVTQNEFVVYEYPLLPDVFKRQRLVLEYATGILVRSALIIDFDSVGDRDSVRQTFEGIRQTLIKQLGRPTRTIEEGQFSTNFISDINAQRLRRIVEWETPAGTIRFGIPRRLDNQVRMEIQYARYFPQPSETLWSIDEVR